MIETLQETAQSSRPDMPIDDGQAYPAASAGFRLVVVLACYNRVKSTLRCLASLEAELVQLTGIEAEIFLLDDASPDGTAQAVRAGHPLVHVIDGTGSLFWNRGMHRAIEAAKAAGPFDALLFLNDDIELLPGALGRALAIFAQLNRERPTILVGAICDEAGQTIYSGQRRTSRNNPLRVERVEPSDQPEPCDTGNGNFLLFPAATMLLQGNLDPTFGHSIGDYDLVYRAARDGDRVMVAPGHVAVGHLNRSATEILYGSTLRQRWRFYFGQRGDPYGYCLLVCRHGRKSMAPIMCATLIGRRLLGLLSPPLYRLIWNG